jgi:hypothetical protein
VKALLAVLLLAPVVLRPPTKDGNCSHCAIQTPELPPQSVRALTGPL